MMQAMRERVKLIYWVVILSFLGLTFLVWGIGLDHGGARPSDGRLVAKVDDHEISYEQWQSLSGAILAQMGQQSGNQNSTENQRIRAREQAFEQLVNETLQRMAAEKMGITVSDEEIVDILSNDPPTFLLEQFRNAEGQIDYDRYFQALNDPTVDWGKVEAALRTNIPLQKLYNRVAGAAVVGDGEIRDAYEEQFSRAVAEYIGVPFKDVETPTDEVPESELRAYYDAHLQEYQQAERASVRLVRMAKEPSEADEQEVVEIIEDLRNEISQGVTSFADAARSYSEDTSASDGGDLGWSDRNRMVAPFTEAAFALPVGALSDPVRTQFGYHLITVTDEKLGDKGERQEIQTSHILLRVDATSSTQADLRDAFVLFLEDAQEQGLDAAAALHELTIETPAPFEKRALGIPGIGNSLEGLNYAFREDGGAISPLFETQDDLYAVEVIGRVPAGPRAFEEVRALAEGAVQREKRAEIAAQKVRSAWAKVDQGRSMESAAKEEGIAHAVTDSFTLRQSIPDVGYASEFSRAALSLEPGDVVREIRTSSGVFGFRLLWRSEFDEDDFRSRRAGIAQSLLYDRQGRVVQEFMDRLREESTIEDYRNDLLRL